MQILEDSRQHKDKHELKHRIFDAKGIKYLTCKLPFGDYSVPPTVAIDTKASMAEIAENIGTKDHERFKNELKLAREYGCHLYILVENTDGIRSLEQDAYWENPRRAYSPKAINGDRLCKAMATMQNYYGCTFLFCGPQESAELIVNILREGK